ncbi:hypothetical protein PATSB16_00430 [Pandoraea thiooxydans]|uniref:CNP1-like uncharacterized domain-containing protein n=2 Tax=Pandoraea thiooxydans TaxID=445709 RepID=A0A0G3EX75_9BURK|nr:hypothetical protein ABW99_19005 [Pandoraea thiooxydans]APR93387.1 hypothetical protein PATSB16_00430 [Pandoraea thiooxydans]
MKIRSARLIQTARPLPALLWLGIAMTASCAALAQPSPGPGPGYDEYMAKKAATDKWKESPYTLPAAPKDSDLLTYTVPNGSRDLNYAIDAKSVSVGKDGVVRFTSVIRSTQGARNVTFEGIHCNTFEYRIYAIGQPDGTWSNARGSHWQVINGYGPTAYQSALYNDYFCDNKMVTGSAADIVQNMRYPDRIKKPE